MKSALADVCFSPAEIGYINAHATSTPIGDAIESLAIDTVFKQYTQHTQFKHDVNNGTKRHTNIDRSSGHISDTHSDTYSSNNDTGSSLYVSSTKGSTGHLLGAAGALESAFTCLALRDNIIPPTLNLDHIPEGEEYSSFRHVPNHAVNYATGSQLYNHEDITNAIYMNGCNKDKVDDGDLSHTAALSSSLPSSNSSSSSVVKSSAVWSAECGQRQQQRRLKYAMNNSFGFGGVNASLIFGPYIKTAAV